MLELFVFSVPVVPEQCIRLSSPLFALLDLLFLLLFLGVIEALQSVDNLVEVISLKLGGVHQVLLEYLWRPLVPLVHLKGPRGRAQPVECLSHPLLIVLSNWRLALLLM